MPDPTTSATPVPVPVPTPATPTPTPATPTPTPAPASASTPTTAPSTATVGKHTDGTRYVSYGNGEVKTGGTVSWRNNNPGNIEAGDFANRHGAIGSDGRFAVFPDADTGTKAKSSLLKGPSYEGKTLVDVMKKYAPAPENDPQAYADYIAEKAGIDTSSVISDLDDDVVNDIVDAMKNYEGWKEGDAFTADDPTAPDWVKDLFPPAPAADPPPETSDSADTSADADSSSTPDASDSPGTSGEGSDTPGDESPRTHGTFWFRP